MFCFVFWLEMYCEKKKHDISLSYKQFIFLILISWQKFNVGLLNVKLPILAAPEHNHWTSHKTMFNTHEICLFVFYYDLFCLFSFVFVCLFVYLFLVVKRILKAQLSLMIPSAPWLWGWLHFDVIVTSYLWIFFYCRMYTNGNRRHADIIWYQLHRSTWSRGYFQFLRGA